MTMIMVAPIDAPDGVLFGHGVNQLTGERIAISCVQHLPAPTITVPSDTGDHMTTLVVEDSASYSRLMSTVANVSASGVSWSASASVSYLREQASSDTAITLTWTRFARTQDRIADWTQATIAPDAITLLQTQGADAFMARYGTHCIVGIAYGGSFSGYSRIETQSVSDKEALKTAISGSVSGFGVNGSVSGSFEQDMQSSGIHYSSSQDTNTIGSAPIQFSGLDISAMQEAFRTFSPSANSPIPGVNGAPVALICASWTEFADIVNAGPNAAALSLATEEHALLALASEYAALSYVAGTAANLQSSPAIIPAYAPTLAQIGDQADRARNRISGLTLPEIRSFASTGTGDFILATGLKTQTDRIARGFGKVRIDYTLDWAFNYANGTVYSAVTQPDLPETNLKHDGFVHFRPEGNDKGDQILSLLYTFSRNAAGTPFIGARMHLQDPYAPEDQMQKDLVSGWVNLDQTQNLSYTAVWPGAGGCYMTVTLVPPTG